MKSYKTLVNYTNSFTKLKDFMKITNNKSFTEKPFNELLTCNSVNKIYLVEKIKLHNRDVNQLKYN